MKHESLFEFLGVFALTTFSCFLRINNFENQLPIAIGSFFLYLGLLSCALPHAAIQLNPLLTLSLIFTGNISSSDAA